MSFRLTCDNLIEQLREKLGISQDVNVSLVHGSSVLPTGDVSLAAQGVRDGASLGMVKRKGTRVLRASAAHTAKI